MSRLIIELPEKLRASLEREAGRLDISVDSLVEGLIKKFLQKQRVEVEKAGKHPQKERRATFRQKADQQVILYFKTDDGHYGLYKTGDLKNLAPGGALVECAANVSNDNFLRMNEEFELIFQMKDLQQPLYLLCKINRVSQSKTKTVLGVSFIRTDDDNYRTMLKYLD
ncbi:MAG: PilZ domain-containing protein [Desulfovibrionaceae bacterium]|nr:PilZ domain-containing protein [Desulfovibrionaceae bacterium]